MQIGTRNFYDFSLTAVAGRGNMESWQRATAVMQLAGRVRIAGLCSHSCSPFRLSGICSPLLHRQYFAAAFPHQPTSTKEDCMRQWLLNVWRMCLGLVAEPGKPSRPSGRAQLAFEQLEDRTVPATFLVKDIFAGSSGSALPRSPTSTARCFSSQTMAQRGTNSGRATALPPAPCWFATSTFATSTAARPGRALLGSPTSTARCFS